MEEEFEVYKARQRETPEAALQQEIATLKGQLAENESRFARDHSEKSRALLEKERYMSNAHKLVSARRTPGGKEG